MFQIANFEPLHTQFVGFDELFNQMDRWTSEITKMPSFPPFDVFSKDVIVEGKDEDVKETHYFVRLAIAGIPKEKLNVKFNQKEHTLSVSNEKPDAEDKSVKYYHNGIARRTFQFSKTISPDLELVKASTTVEPGCLLVEFRKKDEVQEQPDLIEVE